MDATPPRARGDAARRRHRLAVRDRDLGRRCEPGTEHGGLEAARRRRRHGRMAASRRRRRSARRAGGRTHRAAAAAGRHDGRVPAHGWRLGRRRQYAGRRRPRSRALARRRRQGGRDARAAGAAWRASRLAGAPGTRRRARRDGVARGRGARPSGCPSGDVGRPCVEHAGGGGAAWPWQPARAHRRRARRRLAAARVERIRRHRRRDPLEPPAWRALERAARHRATAAGARHHAGAARRRVIRERARRAARVEPLRRQRLPPAAGALRRQAMERAAHCRRQGHAVPELAAGCAALPRREPRRLGRRDGDGQRRASARGREGGAAAAATGDRPRRRSPRDRAPVMALGALDAHELDALLVKTSRTFALSIPLLPEPARTEVGLAYLLFRIADTFEDAVAWPRERRVLALEELAELLARDGGEDEATRPWLEPPAPIAHDGYQELLAAAPRVLAAYRAIPSPARDAICRHLRRSALGMAAFVRRADDAGRLALGSFGDLHDYCYTV